MKIIKTVLHKVLIYNFETLPFTKMISPAGVNSLRLIFNFGNAEVKQEETGMTILNLTFGMYKGPSIEIPIMRLGIEERRILLDIEGTSSDAELIINKVLEGMRSVIDSDKSVVFSPIIESEESEIVAELNFEPNKLISRELNEFFENDLLPMTRTPIASSRITPGQITFFVNYDPKDGLLADRNITLKKKEIIIGVRPGTSISEKIFYSKAPMKTEKHMQLLIDLENKMK